MIDSWDWLTIGREPVWVGPWYHSSIRDHYGANSDSKWGQKSKMAAPISVIFSLIFVQRIEGETCGPSSFINDAYHNADHIISYKECFISVWVSESDDECCVFAPQWWRHAESGQPDERQTLRHRKPGRLQWERWRRGQEVRHCVRLADTHRHCFSSLTYFLASHFGHVFLLHCLCPLLFPSLFLAAAVVPHTLIRPNRPAPPPPDKRHSTSSLPASGSSPSLSLSCHLFLFPGRRRKGAQSLFLSLHNWPPCFVSHYFTHTCHLFCSPHHMTGQLLLTTSFAYHIFLIWT